MLYFLNREVILFELTLMAKIVSSAYVQEIVSQMPKSYLVLSKNMR